MYLGALRQALRDVGYVEGKNIELMNRFADEHCDRFDALATELVEAKVDVDVAIIPPFGPSCQKSDFNDPHHFHREC